MTAATRSEAASQTGIAGVQPELRAALALAEPPTDACPPTASEERAPAGRADERRFLRFTPRSLKENAAQFKPFVRLSHSKLLKPHPPLPDATMLVIQTE